MTLGWLRPTAVALARRPDLWPVTVRQIARLAPGGWWRRPPFLPVPAPDYLGFRLQTMYGDSGRQPEPKDVITYLEWCRRTVTA